MNRLIVGILFGAEDMSTANRDTPCVRRTTLWMFGKTGRVFGAQPSGCSGRPADLPSPAAVWPIAFVPASHRSRHGRTEEGILILEAESIDASSLGSISRLVTYIPYLLIFSPIAHLMIQLDNLL